MTDILDFDVFYVLVSIVDYDDRSDKML
jgi:hypothetical protein